MPFPFSLIPEHIQSEIAEKQEISDVPFSRESSNIALKFKTRFTLVVDNLQLSRPLKDLCFIYVCEKNQNKQSHSICMMDLLTAPVRVVFKEFTLCGKLTENEWEWLTILFSSTNSCIKCLRVGQEIVEYSREQFNALLRAANIEELLCEKSLSFDYLKVPAMKSVKKLYMHTKNNIKNIQNENIHDDDLLALKIPHISIQTSEITNSGINKFLKEWLNGDRVINKVYIGMGCRLDEHIIFNGIPFTRNSPEEISESYNIKNQQNIRIEVLFMCLLNYVEIVSY